MCSGYVAAMRSASLSLIISIAFHFVSCTFVNAVIIAVFFNTLLQSFGLGLLQSNVPDVPIIHGRPTTAFSVSIVSRCIEIDYFSARASGYWSVICLAI